MFNRAFEVEQSFELDPKIMMIEIDNKIEEQDSCNFVIYKIGSKNTPDSREHLAVQSTVYLSREGVEVDDKARLNFSDTQFEQFHSFIFSHVLSIVSV